MDIAERELRIYERVKVDGALQHVVATEFELTQPRISQIVKAVEFWASHTVLPTDSKTSDYEELPRQERLYTTFRLHRDRLERNYGRAMRAWEESRAGQITEKEIRTKDGLRDEFIKKSSPGNPRFLDQAIRFSEKLLKMEGFSDRGEVQVGCHERLKEVPMPPENVDLRAREVFRKMVPELIADLETRIVEAEAAEAAARAAIAAAAVAQAATLAGEQRQPVGTEVSDRQEAASPPPSSEQASFEQNCVEQNGMQAAVESVSHLNVAAKETLAEEPVAEAGTVDRADEEDFANRDVAEREDLAEGAGWEATAEQIALAVLPYEERGMGWSEPTERDANNRLWGAGIVERQTDEMCREKSPKVIADVSQKTLISEGAGVERRETGEMLEERPTAGVERREAGDPPVQRPKRRLFQVGPYPDEERNYGMVFRRRAR
jgi:hypothetical protein